MAGAGAGAAKQGVRTRTKAAEVLMLPDPPGPWARGRTGRSPGRDKELTICSISGAGCTADLGQLSCLAMILALFITLNFTTRSGSPPPGVLTGKGSFVITYH